MILVATVGAILLGTGMMASGRRYYKYWVREDGKGRIIFNNVDAISEADSLELAYEEIEEQTGVKVPQLFYVPKELEYKRVIIKDGMSCIDFDYEDGSLYYQQMSKGKANSVGYNSDREPYKTIYNRFLNQDIEIYKNILETGETEISAQYIIEDTFYYLVGVIDENVMEKLVKNISFTESVRYKK